jgi:hypothetical protein
VKQVGRELGVRYVLGGSLRKAGNRIRVTAQLVEGETGKHVWADPRGDVGKREVCVRTVCGQIRNSFVFGDPSRASSPEFSPTKMRLIIVQAAYIRATCATDQ